MCRGLQCPEHLHDDHLLIPVVFWWAFFIRWDFHSRYCAVLAGRSTPEVEVADKVAFLGGFWSLLTDLIKPS